MSDLDISDTTVAKSNQLNAADLVGKELVIEITQSKKPGGEQPVSLHYKDDNGKPYKPCKSMRRVLQRAWGKDMAKYVGQKLLLHTDDKVVYGGLETGGIRIKAMSGISGPMITVLQERRGKFVPYTVDPLQEGGYKAPDGEELMKLAADAANAGTESLKKFWSALKPSQQRQLSLPALKQAAMDMDEKNNQPQGE